LNYSFYSLICFSTLEKNIDGFAWFRQASSSLLTKAQSFSFILSSLKLKITANMYKSVTVINTLADYFICTPFHSYFSAALEIPHRNSQACLGTALQAVYIIWH